MPHKQKNITGAKYIDAVPLTATALNKSLLPKNTISNPASMNNAITARPDASVLGSFFISTTTSLAEDDKVESNVDMAEIISDNENNNIGHSPNKRVRAALMSSPSSAEAPAKTPNKPNKKMQTKDNQPA